MRASRGPGGFAAIAISGGFTCAANEMPLDSPPPSYSYEMTVAPDFEASPMSKIGAGIVDTVIVPDNPMSTSNFHVIRLSLPAREARF